MTRRLCLTLAAVATIPLMLAAVPPARADVVLLPSRKADGEAAAQPARLAAFGDLRLRWEDDWDSRKSDGTMRAPRDRMRLRARGGFHWMPAPGWKLTLRVRTGAQESPQSPHVTLFALQGGEDGPWELAVDRFLARRDWKRGWLTVGTQGHGFWSQSNLLLDDDIWLHGISGGPKWKSARFEHEVRLAGFVPPNSGAGNDLDERGLLAGGQYVATRKLEKGKLVVAAGLMAIRDDAEAPNPNLDDADFTTLHASVQRRHALKRAPLTWGVDAAQQVESVGGRDNGDQRTSVALHVDRGDTSEPGRWLVGGTYYHCGRWTTSPWLAGDDMVRWTGDPGTRAANMRCLELRYARAIVKNLDVLVRLWLAEGLDPETATATSKETGNRFRVDLNWKF